jgi:hypothetical protein
VCSRARGQGCLLWKYKRAAEKIGVGIGVAIAIAIEFVGLQKPIAIPMPIPTLFMRLGLAARDEILSRYFEIAFDADMKK